MWLILKAEVGEAGPIFPLKLSVTHLACGDVGALCCLNDDQAHPGFDRSADMRICLAILLGDPTG